MLGLGNGAARVCTAFGAGPGEEAAFGLTHYPCHSEMAGAVGGVCSWESRQPPKLPHGVRLLALVLDADVARRSKAPVLTVMLSWRLMLVQIQSSALGPDGVTDRTRLS